MILEVRSFYKHIRYLDGGLRSIDGCIPGHIMAAHFIDGSGTTTDAIDQVL